MADTPLNVAVTDTGGTAEVGGEPDIFAGVGEGAGDAGGGDGSEPDSTVADGGGDPGSDADGADAAGDTEGADGSGDQPAEGEGEGDGEPAEGADEGAAADETEDPAADSDDGQPKTGEPPKPQQPAVKKPLTEEEKRIEATLQEAYRDSPKLKEALKQYPELRGTFFKAAEINRIYPTIKEAQEAKEYALELFKIDQHYYGTSDDSKRAFLNYMWENSLDGQGKSSGHYEQIARMMTTDTISALETQLAQNPQLASAIAANLTPQQASTAVEVVKRLVGLITGKAWDSTNARAAASDANAGDQPLRGPNGEDISSYTPRERALLQQLNAANQKLDASSKSSTETSEANFQTSVRKQFQDGLATDLTTLLSKNNSTPTSIRGIKLLQTWFGNDVRTRIETRIRSDEFFVAQFEAKARSGNRGPEHQAQLAGMLKQRASLLLPTVVREVAAELAAQGKTVAAAAGAGKSQGAGRAAGTRTAPRREPSITGNPGRLTKPQQRPSSPARSSGVMKSTGDYNRDANKILGLDDE